ncbi:DUF1116 domain-containing protein [Pseudorhodoferax sp. Leaf265]|uniref:oxamate carbamoyltransferase subunit AllG family protein n=1 Tax=Pseudorhodoferax sp. Leaf265 TaxID=1736315 RepID=UPI0009E81653|nr:DUF1116 domain-containing protein [Pseudorhodoferax sp. Leaf265]PZQ01437.1 MAG: DUF1116 domain-containing protein [Variovorax paradoxus]PZQ14516.1 MAG: DUF1116 domain-containing protein [Variovorax paradoxus]
MDTPTDFSTWAETFAGAAWRNVVRRRVALPHLGRDVLLHAGPPFDGPPPAPVRQAAVQALLFEGLADDGAAAQALLATGAVRLLPAQDHGVATPLAQVVSAAMPLAEVGDGVTQAWAPLVEGPPPALRFGTSDPAALPRLQAVTELGLQRLAPLLQARPLPLAPVIAQALAEGDECHGRTGAANAALLARLDGLLDADRTLLAGSPGFVLTILMAAAAWRLRQSGAPIAAVGGNGLRFGLRLRGDAGWRAIDAAPPTGIRFPQHAGATALGAIGDSAVLDFCGLGGQALPAAPALCDEWHASLPADLAQRRALVTDTVSGLVAPASVAASGLPPLVNLAVLDASGAAGLIGRGWYAPDPSLFSSVPERPTP